MPATNSHFDNSKGSRTFQLVLKRMQILPDERITQATFFPAPPVDVNNAFDGENDSEKIKDGTASEGDGDYVSAPTTSAASAVSPILPTPNTTAITKDTSAVPTPTEPTPTASPTVVASKVDVQKKGKRKSKQAANGVKRARTTRAPQTSKPIDEDVDMQ